MSASSPNSRPLWVINLVALWVGLFLAMAGMNAAIPFFPLYVKELGITDPESAHYWSGLIQAAPFFLSIITVPLWGTLGDRHGRKLMAVRAALGLALFTFIMGFARTVGELFVLRVLQGAFAGFVSASLGLIISCAPQERSGYAVGMLQNAISIGAIVGPLVGGVLADIYGMRPVMFIVSGLCLAGAMVVMFFVIDTRVPTASSVKSTTWSNFQLVYSNKKLILIVGFISLIQIAMSATQPIFPSFVLSLHAPEARLATITGLLAGVTGICTAICAPLWGRQGDRFGFERTLYITLPIVTVALMGQGAMRHYGYLFPFRMIIGICSAAMVPSLYAALSKLVPQEKTSGVVAVASSAHLVGNLMGPILGSWIAVVCGLPWSFFVAGLITLVVYIMIRSRAYATVDHS